MNGIDPGERRHDRMVSVGIAAGDACLRSIRRYALGGFVAGAVAGGLFGFQAVLSEGWVTGLFFVLGVGLPAGIAGALLATPAGILRGRARRRAVIRRSGFTMREIRSAAQTGAARAVPSRRGGS
jgi:hypothetical protein